MRPVTRSILVFAGINVDVEYFIILGSKGVPHHKQH